jgi:FtsX-like permease family
MMGGLRASFVLRRMGHSRLVLGAVLVTTIIATALTVALAGFGTRALPRAVHQQLAAATSTSIAINGALNAAQAHADTRAIAASMRATFGAVPVALDTAVWSDPLGVPRQRGATATPLLEAAAPGDVRAHAVLISGAWPGPAARGAPVPAAVPLAVADQLHLAPGDVIKSRDRDTGAAIRLRVSGVFAARDPGSPYWGLNLVTPGELGGFITYGPLLVPPGAFADGLLAVGQASWVAVPQMSRVAAADLGILSGKITRAQTHLRQDPALGGLQVTTNLSQLLGGISSNLLVARSLLAIVAIQVLLLTAAALVLAARLLASQREDESALLSARGGARWQLAALTGIEAVLLAAAGAAVGVLLGVRLAGLLADVGPLHVAGLRVGYGSSAVWVPAAAIVVLATAIMIWPALRAVTPGAARVRRGRQAVLASAARAGADVALVGLAVLAGWQLRRSSVITSGATGSAGTDVVLILAPALALAAGTAALLRLLPALARAGDWLAARGRKLPAALASWEISRRPLRQAAPVLLVVLAVAVSALALAQHQSWRTSATEQAAFAAGADVRADLPAPVPLGLAGTVTRAPGVRDAMPVVRVSDSSGGQILALDASRAAATALLSPEESALPAAALWRRITPTGPPGGLVLQGRPDRLEISASLGPGSLRLGPAPVTVSIRDAAGIVYSVPAGNLPADGRRHLLIVNLSKAGQADYPLRLVAMSVGYTVPGHASSRAAAFGVASVAVSARASGGFPAAFAAGNALRSWTPAVSSAALAAGAASTGVPGSSLAGAATLPTVTQWLGTRANAQQLTFDPGHGQLKGQNGRRLSAQGELTVTEAAPTPAVVPGIATQGFLSANQVGVGATVRATIGAVTFPVRIVAAVAAFPTAAGPGGALIVDQSTVQDILLRSDAAPLPVTQWWLRTTGTTTSAVPRALPAGTAVTDRAALASALLANSLSEAPQQAVLAIALAAAVLAAVGFTVSVIATVRDRRAQAALLAALGVSRAAQARQLCLEQLMLSIPAALAGLLLGAVLARLLVPAVTLTATGTAPMPPVHVELPWAWAAALALAVAAVPVLAAAVTVAHRPDPAVQLRTAEAA